MAQMTRKQWKDKLEEHTDPITGEVDCPNKAVIMEGCPITVAAYYNSRWYSWELVD